jgi:cytidylate kinase
VTIALSREAGSHGAEVARAAGALLDWPVYDGELLRMIAEKYGLTHWAASSLDEHYVGWLESLARGIGSYDRSQAGTYLRGLRELLDALGRMGRCVIVGRGAAHTLPRETTVSVRVVGPLKWRVAQAQKQGGLSVKEAEQLVDKLDSERKTFVKKYFGADLDDPALYDLVLNSERLGTDGCAEIVAHKARTLEAQLAKRATSHAR